jgi:hexulose-6-phosphate isomerase
MVSFERREFLTTVASGAALLAAGVSLAADAPKPVKIKKSLKIGMVDLPGTLTEKFRVLKEVGYDGIELDSPTSLDKREVLKARDATGLELNGTVDAIHWKKPFSDPDPAVRAEAVETLKAALRETREFGGTSVLVVPAVVSKEVSYDDAYKRSQAEIKKAIPVAEETGVKIAFENVWNNFLVSPMEAARYIDEFNSPLVCAHFDIGNVLRYGWPEQWIRILGPRVFKLDVKEYSLTKMKNEGVWKGFDVAIGDPEGDCDWPAVMKALHDINYSGWAAAEVSGGGRDRLADISKRMDHVLAM